MQLFDYARAHSLAEATGLLGEGVRVLVGGTDLLVQLRADRKTADRVVDVKLVPELAELRLDVSEGLTLGAAVPCHRVYEDEQIPPVFHALTDAASLIGSTQIQSRASIGGNLCNAAPSADCIPPLMVHRAICRVAAASGECLVNVEDFCTGPGETVLAENEILVSLTLPRPAARTGSAYLRFIPRNEMDIAVAGVAAAVTLEADGETIVDAHVALSAVAPTPVYIHDLRERLIGARLDDAAVEATARLAQAAARPITDMRGSAEQRRHLVGVLTRRALRGAAERARSAPQ